MPKSKNTKSVVIIGGGTGTYTGLTALRRYENLKLHAVVSMCDDGGSTGRLRDEYGILPPGDIRRCIIALSQAQPELIELLEGRFKGGSFDNHNLGNLILADLEKKHGEKYVKVACDIWETSGFVHPVTFKKVRLNAELKNGEIIRGETNIDIPKHNSEIPIKRIFLDKPNAKANPDAVRAIMKADAIIIGPGDLYTSILPNFLINGITSAIKKSKAKKIYVCNLMTKFGETNNYKVTDFLNAVEKLVGKSGIDWVLINNKMPSVRLLKKYKEENAFPVEMSRGDQDTRFILTDLLSVKGAIIRHDPQKLGRKINKLLI